MLSKILPEAADSLFYKQIKVFSLQPTPINLESVLGLPVPPSLVGTLPVVVVTNRAGRGDPESLDGGVAVQP